MTQILKDNTYTNWDDTHTKKTLHRYKIRCDKYIRLHNSKIIQMNIDN